MSDASAFSPDYTAARARFRSAAFALGCTLEELPIGQRGPDGEELTIDAARLGSASPARVVVVSSALHGVEGFLGSAVQSALLEDVLGGFVPPPGSALVLLHALNPYGFAWIRRVNEDNVDLNRNFLLPDQAYSGSPERYGDLDSLLNPRQPPSSFDGFPLRAAWNIARHGMPALKNAVAGGQYAFPQGLFFGGSGPSRTQQLLDRHLPRLLGQPERVLHVDFHTGLGAWADYKLLVDHARGGEGHSWLSERFGAEHVEPWEPEEGVSYAIRGGLGTWCRSRFPETLYDVLAAEFGSYRILRVIAALRAENQAHHWGEPDAPATVRAKAELKEVFAPADRAWRDTTVARGLRIVEQAIEACFP